MAAGTRARLRPSAILTQHPDEVLRIARANRAKYVRMLFDCDPTQRCEDR